MMQRRYNVLICEDEYLLALDVAHDLQAAGHKVVGIVSQLADIETMTRAQKPDCLILDIDLFGSSTVHHIAPLLEQGIAVVVYTGYSDFRPVQAGVPVVIKPAASGQLVQAVEMAVAATSSLGESV